MPPVHVGNVEDRDLLLQIVFQELKVVGITTKIDTPKPPKRNLGQFSTPGGSAPVPGRVFGRRLEDLSKLLVSLDSHTDLLVPKFVVGACNYIEAHIKTEGIYRMAGSSARQKLLRREIEASDVDFSSMEPCPSVLDIASLLKQFLRELPQSILPVFYSSLLCDSLASNNKDPSSLLLSLLLLPHEHIVCLSYLCRHLAAVTDLSASNKMTARNLAIVLTPSLFPFQDVQLPTSIKDRKAKDVNPERLHVHTTVIESLIQHADQVGFIPAEIYEKYTTCQSLPSYNTYGSEDNLDEESGPSKRRSKNKKVRRRSGSLSRMLSVMGKGIRAMTRSHTPNGGHRYPQTAAAAAADLSLHSTPLPHQFGGTTPEFSSPRGAQVKRKASGEHELSPSNKSQKRTFESTFTPKMRSRNFSVKRFKRKKSEGKLWAKESLVIHTKIIASPSTGGSLLRKQQAAASSTAEDVVAGTPQHSIRSADTWNGNHTIDATTTSSDTDTASKYSMGGSSEWINDLSGVSASTGAALDLSQLQQTQGDNQIESDYAEVKAKYEELKFEVKRLEEGEKRNVDCQDSSPTATANMDQLTERYEAVLASGKLETEPRNTARQMARVRRRSSESKKPRSPSERRIGVLRRRSREREQREQRGRSPSAGPTSPAARERGRSPGNARRASPVSKPALTPSVNLNKSYFKGKLQRGQPNSTSSGLEKPSPIPLEDGTGKPRIKMSFSSRERPVSVSQRKPSAPEDSPRLLRSSPRYPEAHTTPAASNSPASCSSSRKQQQQMSHSDSISSLRDHITEIIESSFGSSVPTIGSSTTTSEEDEDGYADEVEDDHVFIPDAVDGARDDQPALHEISTKMANVSFSASSSVAKKGFEEEGCELLEETVTGDGGSTSSSTGDDKLSSVMMEVDPSVGDESSTLTRAQAAAARRQSHGFEFARPVNTTLSLEESGSSRQQESLRRQSSAFEFVSKAKEPLYENVIARDMVTRASLRRRNSSVKDLVLRLEKEARLRSGIALPLSSSSLFGGTSSSSIPNTTSETKKPKPQVTREVKIPAKSSLPHPNTMRIGSRDEKLSSSYPSANLAAKLHQVPTTADFTKSRRLVASTSTTPVRKPQPPPAVAAAEHHDEAAGGEDDMWMDASEFFKNVRLAEPAECGRSSILKLRHERKGRVLDSVVKFSGAPATPMRRGPVVGTRRLSARMGVSASPTHHTGGGIAVHHPPTSTASMTPIGGGGGSGCPPVTRRQTLTGIRTSAACGSRGGVSTPSYANPTVSSCRKAAAARERSPVGHHHNQQLAPPPPVPPVVVVGGPRKSSSSPSGDSSKKDAGRLSDRKERPRSSSRNMVKRTASNTSEAGSSSSGSNRRGGGRNNGGRKGGDRRRGDDQRRYLTIGHPGEARSASLAASGETRSPLKECQNIHANVKRSNSDQTPSKKDGSKRTTTNRNNKDTENVYMNVLSNSVVVVARTHSLKYDSLMSPLAAAAVHPRADKAVRRALSDRSSATAAGVTTPRRSTPRSTPYNILHPGSGAKQHHHHHQLLDNNGSSSRTTPHHHSFNIKYADATPRRSPRLSSNVL